MTKTKKGGKPKTGHSAHITCEELVMEALYDFEEGAMAEAERAELERHLALCPPCVHFLESYRATGKTLRALKPREIPESLARTVFEFVKARCKKP